MSYTSSITVGPGQDYESLTLAHNQVRTVIQDGEHYLYTLVPSSFDYAGVLAWSDFRSFTAGNNVEITVSGNTSGTDPFSYCVEPTTFHKIESNNGGDKTFNFVGISFVASSPLVHRACLRTDEAGLEGKITLNVTNCKADTSFAQAGRIDFIEDRRSDNGGSPVSSLFTYNITNTQFRTDDRGLIRCPGGSTSGNTLINVIGCTLHAADSRFLIDAYDRPGHNFETNLSGCLVYARTSVQEVVDTNSESANFSGTAIDCIFSEGSGNTAVWAPNNRQNVTNGASFFFDPTATAEGDNVYFSGTDTTFTHDYRLYDDPNNLAIGYVTNVTLPSPDLVGNTRGTPYDAGAFALTLDAGGVDVTAAFGNVYLNLY
jgi:hypothetical protein